MIDDARIAQMVSGAAQTDTGLLEETLRDMRRRTQNILVLISEEATAELRAAIEVIEAEMERRRAP